MPLGEGNLPLVPPLETHLGQPLSHKAPYGTSRMRNDPGIDTMGYCGDRPRGSGETSHELRLKGAQTAAALCVNVSHTVLVRCG